MSNETVLQKAMSIAREGRLDEAVASVRAFVRRQPQMLEGLQVLSSLLAFQGNHEESLQHLSRAVAMAPKIVGYRVNLGFALLNAQRNADAAAEFRTATQLDGNEVRGWMGLALAESFLHHSDAAIHAARTGVALRGDWSEMARCLATILESADQLDEAIDVMERAIARAPNDAVLRSLHLLALNYTSRAPQEIADAHRRFRTVVTSLPAPPRPAADAERALRIGVLSGDLRTHSVGYFAQPFFAHKPEGVALIVFATSAPTPNDAMSKQFQSLADEWIEVASMDDSTLDRCIRERKIDVLIDLAAHTACGRLSALDRKPAPVIITAIGYPNTTGHPSIDWRLVDSITDPTGSEAMCSERLLRIDPCFLCYAPPLNAPTPVMPPADAPITFGSFNLTSKVNAETIELWRRVLDAVPNSRLLLKSKSMADESNKRHVLARLHQGGIAAERIDAISFTSTVEEHLALYGRIHVALDATPYNGTTTTCEALWMGVPVVVLEGDRHGARVGASLLRAADRAEFIAQNADEFVAVATKLAQDRAALQTIREGMRAGLQASVLLDAPAYATRFHGAIRSCWRAWCAAR